MVVPGSVLVRVPAKINLHLSVGPLRADGYHELVNVFHAVDLCDDVRATAGDGISLTVASDAADVPVDERNLAWQAAVALARAADRQPEVHLQLTKRIPVAGGMAGGSADAAGALLACARLWELDVDADHLSRLAGALGSDVAFPLVGATAVATGRGELLTPLPTSGRLHWVLALRTKGIPAGDAYRALDTLRAAGAAPAPIGSPEPLYAALARGDVDEIAPLLGNDLQPAVLAIAPELADTLAAGAAAGALAALVSGSGPTCAFLCRDDAQAHGVADALAPVCAGAVMTSGPAPGAAVVG